jgi:hypothetical protein
MDLVRIYVEGGTFCTVPKGAMEGGTASSQSNHNIQCGN